MKLSYFRSPVPNFGDELNAVLWSQILPTGFLDEDENDLFLGIGSIIWNDWPKRAMKHIIGSGYGGYGGPAPDVHDGTWNPVFVRGPRSAKILGLEPKKAICDGAILLKQLITVPRDKVEIVGFMPHFQSLKRGRWAEVCHLAGVTLIDPTDPVDKIMAELGRCKFLITEAMHGAIVSDALRVPWIAVEPTHVEHRMKWWDWADSLQIDLRTHRLAPSTVLETFIGTTKMKRKPGPRAYEINNSALLAGPNKLLIHRAAKRLSALAKMEPQLSKDQIIDSVSARGLEAVQAFVASRRG